MKRVLAAAFSVGLMFSFGAVQGQEPARGKVTVETTETIHALVVPMKGSYLQHEEVFGRIFMHLGSLGQSPLGAPFGRYFNSPGMVPDAELSWEVGVPVGPEVKAAVGFEVKDIPGTLSAVLVHEGPYESSGSAWGPLMQWVVANGYEAAGPSLQIYLGDPAQTGADGPRTELRLPIHKR